MNRRRKGRGLPALPAYKDSELSIKNFVFPRKNRESGKLEKHLPLANAIGPATDLFRRIQEGIKPTTKTDRAAYRHDYDYYTIRDGLRKRTITVPRAKQLVRESDNRLIQTAKSSLSNITNPVNQAHAVGALAGIKSKNIAEDIGLMDPLLFVGKGKDPLKKLRKQLVRCKLKQ